MQPNAHRDPSIELTYDDYFRRVGVDKTSSPSISSTVVRSGERAFAPEVDPASLVARSEPALKELVARLNVHSYVVVPIHAHGIVIGTLSILRSGPGRSYRPEDVVLVEDLADRAGLAIDNARLYRERRSLRCRFASSSQTARSRRRVRGDRRCTFLARADLHASRGLGTEAAFGVACIIATLSRGQRTIRAATEAVLPTSHLQANGESVQQMSERRALEAEGASLGARVKRAASWPNRTSGFLGSAFFSDCMVQPIRCNGTP